MEINAILGAFLGAVLGAIAWAAVAAVTGMELGLVAWGVGGLVGLGAFVLDGRGLASGVVCACLALVAIVAGKFMVINHFANQELSAIADIGLSQELYNELHTDAMDFAQVTSEAEYPAFMVSHGYSEAETPENVFASEIDFFKEVNVPDLQAWAANPPTYEQWRADSTQQAQAFVMENIPLTEIFIESIGIIDIVFFALGIGTAFRVGSGGEFE